MAEEIVCLFSVQLTFKTSFKGPCWNFFFSPGLYDRLHASCCVLGHLKDAIMKTQLDTPMKKCSALISISRLKNSLYIKPIQFLPKLSGFRYIVFCSFLKCLSIFNFIGIQQPFKGASGEESWILVWSFEN